jgi:hypothetical protein
MRSKTPTLAEHLLLQRNPVSGLLGHASRLAAADLVLRQAFDTSLAPRFRLANLRDGVAVIHADSGATSSLLRFRQQELMDILTRQAGIVCERVLIRIDPSLSKL